MRPGYRRRPCPRWRPRLTARGRRGLAAAQRAAQRVGPPRDAALLVLALCGAIAVVVVVLYLLGV